MFLLDDILFSPIKGLAAICRKVHDAAQDDLDEQESALMAELTDLHHQLENSGIEEQVFEEREGKLLDRLDALQRGRSGSDE